MDFDDEAKEHCRIHNVGYDNCLNVNASVDMLNDQNNESFHPLAVRMDRLDKKHALPEDNNYYLKKKKILVLF